MDIIVLDDGYRAHFVPLNGKAQSHFAITTFARSAETKLAEAADAGLEVVFGSEVLTPADHAAIHRTATAKLAAQRYAIDLELDRRSRCENAGDRFTARAQFKSEDVA